MKLSVIIAALAGLVATTGHAADRMVYGEVGRLDSYDPYTIHEASGHRLADLLFDSLVDIGNGGEYIPGLALSWEVSKDKTRVRFTLRERVKWHGPKGDVSYLDARDVVETVRLITSEDSAIPNRDRFSVIKMVTATDPHKVEVEFKQALVDPLRVMTFKILPARHIATLKSLAKESPFARAPIGTGPYQFVKANDVGEVMLTSNDEYFRGAPSIKTIVMRSYSDHSIMAQSLMFNSLDLVTYVSPRDLGELSGDKSLQTVPYDALSFSFIAVNTERKITADKRVRQALAYAIDRKEMLDAFFSGQGSLISGPFSPTSWAYNVDVPQLNLDRTRASGLLDTAGYSRTDGGFLKGKDGKPLSLRFVVPLAGESEMIKRIVLAYQGYLEKVGIKLELQFMDWLVWKEEVLKKHNYDLTIASWTFDDSSNIQSLFHSSEAKPWGNNFVLFKNRDVDALLTEAKSTNDYDKRRAIYHKLHSILADEAPYTYLWTLKHNAAYHDRLESVRIEPFSFFKYVTAWKMKEGKNDSTY